MDFSPPGSSLHGILQARVLEWVTIPFSGGSSRLRDQMATGEAIPLRGLEGRPGFYPWFQKIPLKREWRPTPVFLPGEFRGQRSLVGYNQWGHKELCMTE